MAVLVFLASLNAPVANAQLVTLDAAASGQQGILKSKPASKAPKAQTVLARIDVLAIYGSQSANDKLRIDARINGQTVIGRSVGQSLVAGKGGSGGVGGTCMLTHINPETRCVSVSGPAKTCPERACWKESIAVETAQKPKNAAPAFELTGPLARLPVPATAPVATTAAPSSQEAQ
jgi:hypothetical protein